MPVSITENDAFVALQAFIIDVLPALVEAGDPMRNVRQGQTNRVPMPEADNFVIMVPMTRAALSTTVREYRPDDGERDTTRQTQLGISINFYGPEATDNGQIFNTLFRDLYGCDFMRPFGVQPLYCDDGRQMPLIGDDNQYHTRWMINALLQINPTVSTSQQFADTLAVIIVEAD